MNDYLGREFAIYDKVTGELKEVNIFGNGLIGKIMIDGSGETGYYYSKDHLGSVRAVMSDNGSITSAQDYYPYGELLREYNSASQRYQFTGKEKDGESSYLHFDARTLDPSLPMWLQVDPLADKYPGWSPYNYVLGNPTRLIDKTGKGPGDGSARAIQSELNSIWNTGTQIVRDFYYNDLPIILDAATVGTAYIAPPISTALSVASTGITIDKELTENGKLGTNSYVGLSTTLVGGLMKPTPQGKVIATTIAGYQLLYDLSGKTEKENSTKNNNAEDKKEKNQKVKDEQTIKSLQSIKEKYSPVTTYK